MCSKKIKHIASIYSHICFCIVLLCSLTSCASVCRRTIKNPKLNHWDKERKIYTNLFPPKFVRGVITEYDSVDFLRSNEKKPRSYYFVHPPKGDIDRTIGYNATEFTVTPDFQKLRYPTTDIQITWIIHSTFLIQLGTQYQILIDPVLEPIDGYVGFLMQFFDTFELQASPPISTEDINSFHKPDKRKNIVAISHDHFDHLNFNTIEKLSDETYFYVPLGVEKEFPSRFPFVTGMDWYTSDTLDDIKITFLPANHRSGRSLNIMNKSLWRGWLFEWKGQRIYFAGDTGYSDVFKDIRNKIGKVDICMMPVAAWFQRHWHFAPEDAIYAAQDLDCKFFIPWGYGTWIISYEHILEPPRRLQYAWEQIQPDDMELRMLKMGETYLFKINTGQCKE